MEDKSGRSKVSDNKKLDVGPEVSGNPKKSMQAVARSFQKFGLKILTKSNIDFILWS